MKPALGLAGAALACVAFVCVASVAAPSMPASRCAAEVPRPGQQRLSRLFGELSRTRRFTLVDWSGVDPVVRHGGGSDQAVMASLAGQVNLAVRYVPVHGCPGQLALETVWLLPGGPAPAGAASVVAAPRALPVPPPETPEQRRATDLFVRAHGGAPPGSAPATTP